MALSEVQEGTAQVLRGRCKQMHGVRKKGEEAG